VKAQIGDNLAYGENIEGKQTDYLQVIITHIFSKYNQFVCVSFV